MYLYVLFKKPFRFLSLAQGQQGLTKKKPDIPPSATRWHRLNTQLPQPGPQLRLLLPPPPQALLLLEFSPTAICCNCYCNYHRVYIQTETEHSSGWEDAPAYFLSSKDHL